MVDARGRLEPEVGAGWITVAGAMAMFDGVGSPITQTFGIGLFDPFGEREFEQVEVFFDERGASTCHEVAMHADESTTRLLPARGYAPIEHSTVLVRSTASSHHGVRGDVTVRRIGAEESTIWARTSAQGWSTAGEEVSAFVEQFGRILSHARGVDCFLAEIDAQPVAAAAMNVSADVALFAGASTIPSARGRGAQSALLAARLAYAAELGVDLAMVVTEPASTSQHNAERAGFHPVYSRTKWQRLPGGR